MHVLCAFYFFVDSKSVRGGVVKNYCWNAVAVCGFSQLDNLPIETEAMKKRFHKDIRQQLCEEAVIWHAAHD